MSIPNFQQNFQTFLNSKPDKSKKCVMMYKKYNIKDKKSTTGISCNKKTVFFLGIPFQSFVYASVCVVSSVSCAFLDSSAHLSNFSIVAL